jgi:hypothetical protein
MTPPRNESGFGNPDAATFLLSGGFRTSRRKGIPSAVFFMGLLFFFQKCLEVSKIVRTFAK